jgi:hypothetical protein
VFSFWDYKLLTGTIDYISKSSSLVLTGKINFNTPDGRVGFNGTGKGFLDIARNIVQVEGRVNATIPELGRGAADLLALSADGHNTLAACFLAQAGAVGARYGFVWDLGNWLPSPDSACDIGKFRKAPPAGVGVAGTNRSFTVRPRTPVVVVEVSGPANGTAPAFKLTGPQANAVRLPVPAKNLTYLILRAPRPGRYTISPTAGSVISGLRFADVLPEPKVTGSVSGTVCAPVARWSIKPLPGQSVTIADIGTAGDTRALVPNAPRTGSLTLPLDAQPGLRSLEALVYEGRTLRRTIPLDTYNAPGELSAPLGVRVRRNGKRLVVAWKAVCGATSYRVIVSGRGAATVTKTSYTVSGKLRGRTPTVTVAPVGPDGTVGDVATHPLVPGAF